MSLNDAFRVIETKAEFRDFSLSTETQFSSEIAEVSTYPACLYLGVSNNKKGDISRILTRVL